MQPFDEGQQKTCKTSAERKATEYSIEGKGEGNNSRVVFTFVE